MTTRACPVCEGAGCEECDGTGKRWTLHLDVAGGVTMRLNGTGETPTGEVLADLKDAAAKMCELGVVAGKRRA